MARLQAKSLEQPDEVRPTPFGAHRHRHNLDDLVIGRMVFEPGWHWLEHVQPIAGTSLCQYHHVGICIAGRLGNRLEDGTTIEIGPGMVFDIPPGHDGWVIGEEPFVAYDVAGVRSFARIDEKTQRVLGAILFTDIVDSTALAVSMGPSRWRELVGSTTSAPSSSWIASAVVSSRRRATVCSPCSTVPSEPSARRPPLSRRPIARTLAPSGVSTRARSRSPQATSEDWRFTSPRVSWRSLARARSTCRPRRASSWPTREELAFVDVGIHELEGGLRGAAAVSSCRDRAWLTPHRP